MTVPKITGVELAGEASLPLLVVGPSLGTGAAGLWSSTAQLLGSSYHVLGWNLPGHEGAPVGEGFSMAELAQGVLAWADGVRGSRDDTLPFLYAGDSVGGAVGLQLMLDAPAQVRSVAVLCTAARIGAAEGWHERAAAVRASGTPSMVAGSAQRWFAPGFLERQPDVGSRLLHGLQETDDEGYAQVCEALADFDLRDRLGAMSAPLLAIAGAADTVAPPDDLEAIADGVRHGIAVTFDRVGHLAPAEAPDQVADRLRRHFAGALTRREVYDAGIVVRREVLGDAHVDRATAAITDLTEEFQEFITQAAWGSVWTRPGLDRRSRSMITLTALIARGHHEELEMHLRAALRIGLTGEEIKEVLLQSAIYCGVPDANTAFRIANRVLNEGN